METGRGTEGHSVRRVAKGTFIKVDRVLRARYNDDTFAYAFQAENVLGGSTCHIELRKATGPLPGSCIQLSEALAFHDTGI